MPLMTQYNKFVAFLTDFLLIEALYVNLPLRNGLSCFMYIRKLVSEDNIAHYIACSLHELLYFSVEFVFLAF